MRLLDTWTLFTTAGLLAACSSSFTSPFSDGTSAVGTTTDNSQMGSDGGATASSGNGENGGEPGGTTGGDPGSGDGGTSAGGNGPEPAMGGSDSAGGATAEGGNPATAGTAAGGAAPEGGAGGTAGATAGGAGGMGAAGAGDGGAGGTGNGGECGCVSTALSWGPDGGFVAYQVTSTLSPCATFTHTRDPIITDPPTVHCEQEITTCGETLGAKDVAAALANAQVQDALEKGMVLYGSDPRAVDGQVFRVEVGESVIEVGNACRDNNFGCTPIPEGIAALRQVLQRLTEQQLALEPCSNAFGQ